MTKGKPEEYGPQKAQKHFKKDEVVSNVKNRLEVETATSKSIVYSNNELIVLQVQIPFNHEGRNQT